MYNIDNLYLGNKLKYYRKLNNLSLQDLGNIIGKSKTTILKYENGTIIPDINTILELCNNLNIHIEQILQYNNNNNNNNNNNLNNKNETLYLYYYSKNKLIFSIIEILKNNKAILYNDIINNKSKFQYKGIIKKDSSNVFLSFSNDKKLEEVSISYNLKWDNTEDYNIVFIQGIDINFKPKVHKALLRTKKLKDLSILEKLKISKEELMQIGKNNMWILK